MACKRPSYVKDTTHFLNKINEINQIRSFPPGTLLVTWDIEAIFPNIDNEDGLRTIKKHLTAILFRALYKVSDRSNKNCFENNNAEFEGQHYVQTNGTAMGPKKSCSYADVSMTEVDQVATSQGPYKPEHWYRFRDDVFDIWTHVAEALFEFTDFLNSIGKNVKWKTNLRFKLESYSKAGIHYLDTEISLIKGKLQVDMFSKPTDVHLYLLPTSNHPNIDR